MEEVIYEEVEEEERKKEDVVTDDEIEEDIDQFKNKTRQDNKQEVSEASDIPEEMSEEQDDEILEAIEYEDDTGQIHIASN